MVENNLQENIENDVINTNFEYLKYVVIPYFYKNRGKSYTDGYTFALVSNKLITNEEFEELRKVYWDK